MAQIDYAKMCEKVRDVLSTQVNIEKKYGVPPSILTSRGKTYEVRLGAIFVDMRKTRDRFSSESKDDAVKIAKTFDGTMLKMMNTEGCVEIGVRGNCVFAYYGIDDEDSVLDMIEIAAGVNSSVQFLNRLYSEKNMDPIKAGIGISYSRGLITRVRNKSLGDRGRIWISDAISDAERFAKIGNSPKEEGTYSPIVVSNSVFSLLHESTRNERILETRKFVKDDGFHHGDLFLRDFEIWKGENLG